MKAGLMKLFINFYPPWLFTGIRVTRISPDFREADVEMRHRFYNRNYVGTHFGGSLCAMIDPFYMLMLMNILDPSYIVWDKSAEIEFVKPGKGTVYATFRIDDQMLDDIKARTSGGEKYLPQFPVEIQDSSGEVVVRAVKTLYIRKKNGG